MQLRTRKTHSDPESFTDRQREPRTQRSQATLRSTVPDPDRGQSVWTSPSNISTEINGMAASLAEVDPRSSARLRDLGNALATDRGRQRWSDVDLSRAFNTDRLSLVYAVRREGGYAPSSIEIADKIRNVLVLVPILLTWAALAEAARAYNRYINANPEEAGTPFLLLWQRGFGGESGILSPTFSTVAIIDAVVIVVMILLTLFTHGRRETQEDRISDTASAFQAEFDNVLAEATVMLGGDRSDRPAQLSDSVERLADRFERSSQELLTQLQVEHDRLENLATRREREFADFGKFASGMRSGAEEMHRLLVDLRQVSSGLETALEDLTGEVSTAADQQKSLLTAVSHLDRVTSSAVQSDQALTRQLAIAANTLSDTAEKAITGAESAAQAGRIASDAVRAIGDIAREIGQSQDRVEKTLAGDTQANGRLAEALRVTTVGTQSNTRALDEIGTGLNRIREEFERLGSQTGTQANALSGLLSHQGDIAKDISQVARDMGSVGLNTAQRQRELNQDLQHLVQRLDGLATTLNRLIQQSPNSIRADRDRDADGSVEEPASGGSRSSWGRSPRS